MFKPGNCANPKGRPKGSRNIFTETDIRKALLKAKKEHGGIGLLEHLVSKAYSDTKIAVSLLKKLLPDLSHVEVSNGVRDSVWASIGTPADMAKQMDELTVGKHSVPPIPKRKNST